MRPVEQEQKIAMYAYDVGEFGAGQDEVVVAWLHEAARGRPVSADDTHMLYV